MSDFLPDPPRWKDGPDAANLAEREAGRVIRLMHDSEPLPAAQLTRVAARIRAARSQPRSFWLAVTAVLLLGGATVASAAYLNVLPGWLTRIVNSQPAESVPHKRASVRGPKRLPATVNEPASAEANPLLASSVAIPDQPVRESASAIPVGVGNSIAAASSLVAPRTPLRRPAGAAPAESPTIARVPARAARLETPRASPLEPASGVTVPSEAQHLNGTQVAWLDKPDQPDLPSSMAKYLSEAIHALRVERSPGTALFLLDCHATQLGKSAFAHEALLLRVEAMVALGRKAEVLRLLDSTSLTDVAASRSLLVTRGELRAAANRCADGIGDFDLVLTGSKQADRQALFGRAVCRKKLGDSAGAQADVERYRREFPADPRLTDLSRLK